MSIVMPSPSTRWDGKPNREVSPFTLIPNPDALDFVRRCERPPFGIDVNPTSVSSSLECLRAGLHLLCLFGVTPMYPEEIRNFTRSCQTDTGGFGRAPGAIARLDDTLQALKILSMVPGRYSPEAGA